MNRHFQYFGLQQNPFCMSPYPSYLLVNRKTQSTLDDMADAIRSGKGLLVLTGDVGTGKTTLIRRLVDWLTQQGIPTAFIFNARLEAAELFEMILDSFGALHNRQLRGTSRQRLSQWLTERNAARMRPVLIIDEAQGLPMATLEELRLLLNQEHMGEKVIQIILSGQPELDENLKNPKLRQMRQRIELRRYTSAFNLEESCGYIQKRIDVAGAKGKSLFPTDAAEAVHFYARGVPRVMNLLCEQGLRRAFERHLQSVRPEIVDEVARELQLDGCRPISKSEAVTDFTADIAKYPPDSATGVAIFSETIAPNESAGPPESLRVALAMHAQVADARSGMKSQTSEELQFLTPIQMEPSPEPSAQSLVAMPAAEVTAITRTSGSVALRVATPMAAPAKEPQYTSPVTAIVRAEGPERRWIQQRRRTLEQSITLSIASVFNRGWQRWQEQYAALGRWLCGPMPFGRRKEEEPGVPLGPRAA
jgi:general secretion pathway protein A